MSTSSGKNSHVVDLTVVDDDDYVDLTREESDDEEVQIIEKSGDDEVQLLYFKVQPFADGQPSALTVEPSRTRSTRAVRNTPRDVSVAKRSPGEHPQCSAPKRHEGLKLEAVHSGHSIAEASVKGLPKSRGAVPVTPVKSWAPSDTSRSKHSAFEREPEEAPACHPTTDFKINADLCDLKPAETVSMLVAEGSVLPPPVVHSLQSAISSPPAGKQECPPLPALATSAEPAPDKAPSSQKPTPDEAPSSLGGNEPTPNEAPSSLEGTEPTPDEAPSSAAVPAKAARKYKNRRLLHRQKEKGLLRLGGGNAKMLMYPGRQKWMAMTHERLRKVGLRPAMAYDCSWQPFGPRFAGDNGFVRVVPIQVKLFSLFMKRVANGKLLGWEYCGEYTTKLKVEGDNDDDVEVEVDENDLDRIYKHYEEDGRDALDDADPSCKQVRAHLPASRFSEAAKRSMLDDILASLKHGKGRWGEILPRWKDQVVQALKNEKRPLVNVNVENPNVLLSLAAKARYYKFREDISLEEFAKMALEFNEFHFGYTVRFVRYDEKVYNYLKNGATEFRASDWYDHDSQG
jgi:hypothetical protein